MIMKRILLWTLMFLVLVTAGCDSSFGDPPANTGSGNPRSIEWAAITAQTKNLLEKINAEGSAELKVSDIAKDVQVPLSLLGKDNNEFKGKCSDCSADVLRKGEEARASLQKVVKRLGDEKPDALLNDQIKSEIIPGLNEARTKLEEVQRLNTPAAGRGLTEYLILGAMILGGVLVLVLLASAFSYLWKRSWRTVEFNVGQVLKAHLAAAREAQPDYAPKLSSLSSAQAEMSSRLNDLDSEVRSLARLVRESLATRRSDHNTSYSGLNYNSQAESVSPKDEPEFPVSAVDYLGKMNRFANVVRPDFQNGILVHDPDGDGELVLIRDSRDDTQPLFVVPRATQFQTKQDFYTYYQKYYDCARPTAGDVWIIGPAVVEKVAGGWRLRDKGMLEIR
jgi:hypothetical protein